MLVARTAASRRTVAAATPALMRGYAAAAAGTQNVKPPIALFGLDGTYATALVGSLPTRRPCFRLHTPSTSARPPPNIV